MAHRVQLSLQILDDNLYNGLIEDLKANRELNSKVVDVLSAYYYDESIRNKIESYLNGDTINETYDKCTNTDELFADIHNAMAMSNFYATEATQTLEDGTDMVDDILNQTSKQAEEDGIIDTVSTSEFGYEIPKLLTTIDEVKVQKVAKMVQEKVTSTNTSEPTQMNEQFLEKVVFKLCEMVGLDPSSVDDTKDNLYANIENSNEKSDNLVEESKKSDNIKVIKEEKTIELVRPEPEKPIAKEVNKEDNSFNIGYEEVEAEIKTETVNKDDIEKETQNTKDNLESDLNGFNFLMESLNSLDF